MGGGGGWGGRRGVVGGALGSLLTYSGCFQPGGKWVGKSGLGVVKGRSGAVTLGSGGALGK